MGFIERSSILENLTRDAFSYILKVSPSLSIFHPEHPSQCSNMNNLYNLKTLPTRVKALTR